MRKITLLLSGLAIAFSSIGQEVSNQEIPEQKLEINKAPAGFSTPISTKRAMRSRWLNYPEAYVATYGTSPDANFHYLFPDSAIKWVSSTGLSDPFIHSIGHVFDLKSDVWMDNNLYTPSADTVFTIDSISVEGFYDRVNNNSVDTLVITIVLPSTDNLGTSYYYPGMMADYGTDTVRFIAAEYDFPNTAIPAPTQVIKVPLDAAAFADSTANGTHIISVEVPGGIQVPVQTANTYKGVFGVFVDYKPGYTYTTSDTLSVNKNAWLFLTYELNGPSTFPYYTPGDYNSGHTLGTRSRYNYPTNGYNGLYHPMYAWVAAGWYEAFPIAARITQDDGVSINEVEANNNLKLFPNPANENVTVKFNAQGDSYLVNITDITGKVVMTQNGNTATGEQVINVNTSKFVNGTYFVTVNNGVSTTTQRLVIVK